MIKSLPLLLLMLPAATLAENIPLVINDLGTEQPITINGLTLEGSTGELTLLLPDSSDIPLFNTGSDGNAAFMDLQTFNVRVCKYRSFNIDAAGKVTFNADYSLPCLASNDVPINVCDTDNVMLREYVVPAGTFFICEGFNSLVSVNSAHISTSTTTLISPSVHLLPGTIVETGAVFHVISYY